jgi:diguanylate cyclase (GGDEF)-like protein
VDMDGLKRINDSFGHLTGDHALAEIGGILRRAVRTSDIVGRYGGDEFAVILPQTPPEGALKVGERILELIRGQNLPAAQEQITLLSSLGLGALDAPNFPGANIPYRVSQSYFQMMAQTLLLQADEALYRAKRGGGNQLNQGPAAQWQMPSALSSPVA